MDGPGEDGADVAVQERDLPQRSARAFHDERAGRAHEGVTFEVGDLLVDAVRAKGVDGEDEGGQERVEREAGEAVAVVSSTIEKPERREGPTW